MTNHSFEYPSVDNKHTCDHLVDASNKVVKNLNNLHDHNRILYLKYHLYIRSRNVADSFSHAITFLWELLIHQS